MDMIPASFSFDMSYCGSPPTLESLWSRWNFEPVLVSILILAALAGTYLLRSANRGRQIAFTSGWLLSAGVFISPLCALTVALFSARVGHHVILTMAIAPLLALALPAQWGRNLPLMPALVVSSIALWLWHVPDIYASAFLHPAIYGAMQLSLLGSFTWLWLGLLRSEASLSTGLIALLSAIQMGLLGALLVFAPQPLYVPHFTTALAFGLEPLADQQLGGLIMWVPANLPLLALVLWRLVGALGGQEATSR